MPIDAIPSTPAILLVPRTARTIDLAVGGRREGPILLRAPVIMATLDAGAALPDVQIGVCHADTRTTAIYDRRRQNFDRHAASVVALVASG